MGNIEKEAGGSACQYMERRIQKHIEDYEKQIRDDSKAMKSLAALRERAAKKNNAELDRRGGALAEPLVAKSIESENRLPQSKRVVIPSPGTWVLESDQSNRLEIPRAGTWVLASEAT